jgi:predicted DNA-binding transcriptional regulator YafY
LKPLEDGALHLQAKVVNTEQLRWWLLGFGDKVEVIKPKTLRQELAQIAASLHATYSRN